MPTFPVFAPITLAIGMTPLDWTILGAYMAFLVAAGAWLARREPTGSDEYFLASRRMPVWAVAFSIVASSLSVATFIGGPEQSFRGDLTYLSTNLGGILAVFVVAWVFIPAFYRANCTTIYEVLEHRMGRGAKEAASAAFMTGRVFASGARLYIAALPMAAIAFSVEQQTPTTLILAIVVLAFAGVVVTLVGGIASVIWTDVLQTFVMLGAVIGAIVYLLWLIPAPIGEVVNALHTGGVDGASKLAIIRTGIPIDLSQNFTLLTAVLGFSLIALASNGTDHDMVQRMLTCKSAVSGGRSVLLATFAAIPVVSLFMVVGLLIWVFYTRADLMGDAGPSPEAAAQAAAKGAQPFLLFIVNEIPSGLRGAMVAGIFAVGLGSLNSAINAMAATFVKDFYTRWVPAKSERHYLAAGRWAVVGWGVVLAAFATLCVFWRQADGSKTLIDFAIGVMTFAYTGLLAIFLTALFTKRGSSASAIGALITGFTVVLFFQTPFWLLIAKTGVIPPTVAGLPHDALTIQAALPWLKVAFPWHMLVGTVLATGVCLLGRRPTARIPTTPQ